MFCLWMTNRFSPPSNLIINVFNFLIKIALFYLPFIRKRTISQVLSKAVIQSELLFTKNTKSTIWAWLWGCWRCFRCLRCLRSFRWCRLTNLLPVRPRNQQIWFFKQNHNTIKPIKNERFSILCRKIYIIHNMNLFCQKKKWDQQILTLVAKIGAFFRVNR